MVQFPASAAALAAVAVDAVVGRLWPLPSVNWVEVAWRLHPAPLPPISEAVMIPDDVAVLSKPLSVTEPNPTLAGGVTVSDPVVHASLNVASAAVHFPAPVAVSA